MIASEFHAAVGGDDTLALLLWRLDPPMTVASTALLGGGVGLRRWIVNAQVPPGYGREDPERHVAQLAADLGGVGAGVGMLTAVDVADVVRTEDGGLSVEATVGVIHPTWAAAPDEADIGLSVPGTINVVAFVPAPLTEAALLNALCTVTEAKAQALMMVGVPGTGTASDAVTVMCPAGTGGERFGGPRSTWGSKLARAVCEAVSAGCKPPAAHEGGSS